MRTIQVTTADGVVIPIQFHRTAAACWHVLFPHYVEPFRIQPLAFNEYTYTGPNGESVLATTSLERAMVLIAEQITRTEF